MHVEKVYCDECNTELTDKNRAMNPLQIETMGYMVTISVKDINAPRLPVDLCQKCFAHILAHALKKGGVR